VVAKSEPPVQPVPEPVAATPVTAPVHEEEPAPAKLPDTASEYPLVALIGLGSVIVSKFMYRLSKRA
jgi:hypothetical protein